MLSAARKSRRRLAGGAAIVGTLILTGLGLTASGTQAAEGLRARVGKTIGVDLSQPVALAVAAPQDSAAPVAEVDPNLPPPPPPPAPAPDPAPAAMPAPPAPPAPLVDGKAIQAQVDAAMAHMPEVSSRNCGGNDVKQMVINEQSGGKNRIIICEDRIARVAAQGAEMAANSAEIERNAYRSALAGLQSARAGLAANPRLSAAERDEALSSIDESIKEMQDDLAHAGEDD